MVWSSFSEAPWGAPPARAASREARKPEVKPLGSGRAADPRSAIYAPSRGCGRAAEILSQVSSCLDLRHRHLPVRAHSADANDRSGNGAAPLARTLDDEPRASRRPSSISRLLDAWLAQRARGARLSGYTDSAIDPLRAKSLRQRRLGVEWHVYDLRALGLVDLATVAGPQDIADPALLGRLVEAEVDGRPDMTRARPRGRRGGSAGSAAGLCRASRSRTCRSIASSPARNSASWRSSRAISSCLGASIPPHHRSVFSQRFSISM